MIKPTMRKGDGPGANRMDGNPAGRPHAKAQGLTGGRPDDLQNGSPNRGPSMGGILKYIRERGSGERSAPDSGGSATPSGASAGNISPYPTGGEPLKEHDQGNDVPGESSDEDEQDEPCMHCGRSGPKGAAGELKRSQGNKESYEPMRRG
jgi:hypothetical protein